MPHERGHVQTQDEIDQEEPEEQLGTPNFGDATDVYLDEEYQVHVVSTTPAGNRVETTYDSPAQVARPTPRPEETPARPAGQAFTPDIRGALFDPTQPRNSLINALMDLGIPWTGPVAQRAILPHADALSSAFTVHRALVPEVSPEDDTGAAFRSFLTGAVNSGNIRGAVSGAASRLPELVAALREQQQLSQVGGTGLNNPIRSGLAGALQNSGAVSALYQALMSPQLGDRLTESLGQMLNLRANATLRSGDPMVDAFKTVLGI